jgi:rhomboid protease GluP
MRAFICFLAPTWVRSPLADSTGVCSPVITSTSAFITCLEICGACVGLGRLTQLFYSPRNYFMVYTFAGLCGSLLSVWAKPGVISAGASGAVFGVAGVMLTTLQFGKLPINKQTRDSIFKGVLQFAALNLVIGLAIPHVDNIGHIGGLLAGLLLGIVFGKHLDDSTESRRYRRTAWLSLIFVYLLALIYVAFAWNGIAVHVHRT